MAEFMSIRDADFWKNCPEDLKLMQEGRGTGAIAYFLLGPKAENPPTAVVLKLGPGQVLPRHAHDCYRFEAIIQGSMDVGDRILAVGDIMVSDPYESYGPHVAGPEGCTSIEIFSTLKAAYSPVYELPEGRVQIDVSTPEGHEWIRAYQKQLAEDGVKPRA